MQEHEHTIYLIVKYWHVGEEAFETLSGLILLSPVIVSCWPE